jgi:MYXO-CTERM domain-containing protein
MVLLLPAATSAWAQDADGTPTPKELWEAYPLDPGETPPTATATASAEMNAGPKVTPAPASSSDDGGGGGIPLVVPIALAALLALGAGVGLSRRRGRGSEDGGGGEIEKPEPPAPRPSQPEFQAPITEATVPARRFEKRKYAQPARPAPPPPPVPGGHGPDFEVALDDERSSQPSRNQQREPH